MHASAYQTACQFFEVYGSLQTVGTVVEVGSRQASEEHRTLRHACPAQLTYVGVDLQSGVNVDLVLSDPYVLPLDDASVDIVLCTSVFEHSEFFWALFEEIMRVLRTGGLLYVNAPSNGYVHRHPVDCWRFYPDSGVALAEWGCRQGHDVGLLESFITDEDLSESNDEIWNDFVAVFIKGKREATRYPRRMLDLRKDYANARRPERTELIRANRFPGRSQEEISRWLRSTQSGFKRAHLYQIAYSEETWRSVPEGLLTIDNRANERPDWAEYWPIRRFLQHEVLDEAAYYGFLSPRVSEKILFPAEALIDFVTTVADDVDVAAFSPAFDQRAIFRNVFEQGEFFHPGLMDLSRQVVHELLPGVELRTLVNTSFNGIFSNYFAARPRFWRQWLALCEGVFAMAESPDHPCSMALNRDYMYRSQQYPAKIFVIERIASLLLATSTDYKIDKFANSTLNTTLIDLPYALLSSLDQLKVMAEKGHPMLLNAYCHIQREILSTEAAKKSRDGILHLNFPLGHAPSHGYEHWGSALPETPRAQEVPSIYSLLKALIGRN